MSDNRTVAERFWVKVDRNGPIPEYAPHLGPCWLWTASTIHGYGTFSADGKGWRAHRFSYTAVRGPIPEGLHLDHLCRVRNCVNPAHLEAVTSGENTRRGTTRPAENAVKTHCLRGHPLDEVNTYLRPDGKGRQCRTCHRVADNARTRVRRARARALRDGAAK